MFTKIMTGRHYSHPTAGKSPQSILNSATIIITTCIIIGLLSVVKKEIASSTQQLQDTADAPVDPTEDK